MKTVQVLEARGGRQTTDKKTGDGFYYDLRKGDVVQVDDDEAERWIEAGQAQEVEVADAPDLRQIMTTPRQDQLGVRALAHTRNGIAVRRPPKGAKAKAKPESRSAAKPGRKKAARKKAAKKAAKK